MQAFLLNMKHLLHILKHHPALAWKLSSALLFTLLGAIILLGLVEVYLEDMQRKMFGGLLLLYGVYRFITFIVHYRQHDTE